MNVYQISFTRKNGSTGSDRITAPNEEKAQRDFKRVYRPSDLDITGITLVESNVPATKQQERDALWEIRKIVEELGPSSYVATAFQGCFEDAMDNIENDFASSYYTRWATEKRRADGLEEEVSDLRKTLTSGRCDNDQKDIEISALQSQLEAAQKDLETAHKERSTMDNLLADAVVRADTAEQEIIRLKAKLYDYMEKEVIAS